VVKVEPVGTCDLCKGPIPPDEWYTRRGPRRYCSRECRNTANSRAGSATRLAKLRQRIAAGAWRNPATLRPPTGAEQASRARKGRQREVSEGRWRNPALSDAARAKLSRPRRHTGVLHSALEKLKRGLRVAALTAEEQDAHRAYRRQQRAELWARTPEEQRARLRAKWREDVRRR
jgi:hypothetical protein